MLKGVNKQILEVTNPESEYFEKIIFFVKSNSPTFDELKLKNEAEKITKKAKRPPKIKRNPMQILSLFCYSLISIGIGVAITFLINKIM